MYPVVNKVKVKNKKKSVVPVVPEVIESEKSDEKSDDTDNPLFIEGIVRSLLPYIYFTCFIVFLLTNVINISTVNLIIFVTIMCTGMLAWLSQIPKVCEKIYTFSFSLQGLVSYFQNLYKPKEPVVAAINLDIKTKLPFMDKKEEIVEPTSEDIKLSDTACVKRGLTDIDLTTKKEKNLSYYHFKVHVKLGMQNPY